jgi:hypothetical protein
MERLHSYFESMAQELSTRKPRGRTPGKTTVEDKLHSIRAELDRKIHDLDLRYALRISVRPAAVERMILPVLVAACHVRWKTAEREVPIVFNPALHALEPLACDDCGVAMREVQVGDDLRLCCSDCASGVRPGASPFLQDEQRRASPVTGTTP